MRNQIPKKHTMANRYEDILILRCNDSAQIQRAVKAYNKNRLLWEFFPQPNAVHSDILSGDWLEQNWGSGSDASKDPYSDDNSQKTFPVNKTAPTDQHGKLLSKIHLSVAQVIDEFADLRDYPTVEVTLDENDPTKVLLKFKRGEMSDETGRASKPD